MTLMKSALRSMLRQCGYRVTRLRPPNRFQGMEETLISLRGLGYSPRLVIDAGANRGTWTKMVRSIFPEASVHMIEPQPACTGDLQDLAASNVGLYVYPSR